MTYRINQQPFIKHRPQHIVSILSITISLALVLVGYTVFQAAAAGNIAITTGQSPSPLIITAVQTGACTTALTPCPTLDPKKEYIELYNTQDTALNITNWRLEYVISSGKSPYTVLANLTGRIAAHSYVMVSSSQYGPPNDLYFIQSATDSLIKSAGHVQIVDANGSVIDKVGWGYGAKAALGKPVTPIAISGESIRRRTNLAGNFLLTGNNHDDFEVAAVPDPQGGGFTAFVDNPAVPTTPAPSGIQPPALPATPPVLASETQTLLCTGLAINEILPNPASTDTGNEFIELYNTGNTPANLSGCKLQISASTSVETAKLYALPNVTLSPGGYYAFYDSTASFLPNASGGSIWLIDSSNQESMITYPDDLNDDVAWVFDGSGWAASYTITPSAANILTASQPCPAGQMRNVDTNRCNNIEAATTTGTTTGTSSMPIATESAMAKSATVPCNANQTRNPETNRCRNNATAAATASCPASQSRNLETNRCKSDVTNITVNASACKAGQERNPETNRCKNIAADSTAKACPTGQERNIETNRCRKTTAAGSSNGSSLNDVKDVANSTPIKNRPYWLIAAVALAAAIGYGLYEWRQEITECMRKRFTRSFKKNFKETTVLRQIASHK